MLDRGDDVRAVDEQLDVRRFGGAFILGVVEGLGQIFEMASWIARQTSYLPILAVVTKCQAELHGGVLAADHWLMRQRRWSRFDMDPIGISVRLTQCEAHSCLAGDKYAPKKAVFLLCEPAAARVPTDREFV